MIEPPSSCRIAARAAVTSFALTASSVTMPRHLSCLGQELRCLEAPQRDQLRVRRTGGGPKELRFENPHQAPTAPEAHGSGLSNDLVHGADDTAAPFSACT